MNALFTLNLYDAMQISNDLARRIRNSYSISVANLGFIMLRTMCVCI